MVAHAMAVDATARAAHGIATTQVPLGLELRHLRYLAAVADAGTFTHAAERLFIAQPTLSQQIRRLEQIVGTSLLHRRRDGVRLTAGFSRQPRQKPIAGSPRARPGTSRNR